MKRGISTIADLRARSIVDPVTGCWHWQGAMSGGLSPDGKPRQRLPVIYTWCHARNEKRPMSGPLAVWNIAHQCSPLPGWLIFRRCVVHDCVNPVHHKEARSRAEIGSHIQRSGRRKGNRSPLRIATALRNLATAGVFITPDEMVRQIRASDASLTHVSLAAVHGISVSTVSKIRSGKSRLSVAMEASA